MRRMRSIFFLLLAVLALAGCDKCGGFQEIRTPLSPNVCGDAAPQRK